jgi:hypothetical protein
MVAERLLKHPARRECTPEEAAQLCEQLQAEQGYYAVVPVGLEEYAAVHRFMYTWGLLRGLLWLPEGYEDRWCYATLHGAVAGLAEWRSREFRDEPQGWHRHPATGRRRPEGDATREYINH